MVWSLVPVFKYEVLLNLRRGQLLKDTCERVHLLSDGAVQGTAALLKVNFFIDSLQKFFSCLRQYLRCYQEFGNSYL